MQANDFDALLRSRFDAYQPEYNADAWKSLADKLPPAQSAQRRHALWPVGLGLAASIAAAGVFIFHQPAPQNKVAGLQIKHSAHRPAIVAQPSPAIRNKAIGLMLGNVQKSGTDISSDSHQLHVTVLLDEPAAHPAVPQEHLQLPADPLEKEPLPAVVIKPDRHTSLEYPMPAGMLAEKSGGTKTIISLAGGLQYGSLNAGYAAGIQVRHKFSSRWYAETEIGYQHYAATGANQLSAINYNTGNGTGSGSISPDSTRAKLQPHQIVQYIQASPGIGYHLSRSISIGAGADFQRALQSSDQRTIKVDGNDLKPLPLLDIGATGQVSFRISEWLEAGILYRQGINNLLQPRQSYLDRQYMQVQLKVPLIRR